MRRTLRRDLAPKKQSTAIGITRTELNIVAD